ncbi:hypothetical protein LuPra_04034 [Luteitalea pratensis]|uniref:Alginate export domain-containing protein n=1 Tax=Luteitalea pratensis TaxID=1855912 RepID=A0A143PRI5_LUTPR|nr:alginate export family protein [Luteitalea pratensis]AMY10793.1 hypothetical protein LuPra_04034 [Luteitalea pratensis]
MIQRSRYASLRNQFRPGLTGDDQALALRTTLRVDLPLGRVRLVGELQDARAYLTDTQSNVSTALVDAFDLLQAHVRLPGGGTTKPFFPEVQAGRFSMELGSGRLVAQEAYRDVTRTFTGIRLNWRNARQAITTFAVIPVLTLPDDRQSLFENRLRADREHLGTRFWGVFYERPRLVREVRAEAYGFRLDEHDASGTQGTRDRHIWTGGARAFRASKPQTLDLDVEAAGQTGAAHASNMPSDRRPLDVSAWFLHSSSGYTFGRAWSPRIGVEYDFGSGDENPGDARWNRFDALFGNRRVDLAPTSIYGALGRENIRTAGVRLSVAPAPRLDGFAVYRWVGLAAAADAFASTGVRDPSGHSGRDGGRQVDVRIRAWIVPQMLRMETGLTHLIPGRFLRDAPNATQGGRTTFFYADVTYSVSGTWKRGFHRRAN